MVFLVYFGMSDEKQSENKVEEAVSGKKSIFARIKDGLKKAGQGIAKTVQSVANTAKDMIKDSVIKKKMSNLADIMHTLDGVRTYLDPWQNRATVNGVKNLTKAVNAINKLDLEKASTMIELFRSFSGIGIKPFDRFTEAVHEFSDSCNKLIVSMNGFNPIGENTVTTGENGETRVSSGSINIENTDALADALAKAIKSLPINVETNISDVRLVVNGESGRRVVLTLDN